MSPIATSASTTVVDNGTPNFSAMNGFTAGGGKGGKRVFPHIDDITHVTPDVSTDIPIEKVLATAENHMRSAETFKSFNRPDFALKEYMISYQIVAEVVSRHPDYLATQGDRKQLGDRYKALIKKINAHHAAFDRIKQEIKADNAKTGVQRTLSRPSTDLGNDRRPGTTSTTTSHGISNATNGRHETDHAQESAGETSKPKSKPAVHPKPQALVGNAIKPGVSSAVPATSKTAQELATRFANLRAAPNQEARSRTQQTLPKPMGPREMPSAHRPTVSLDGVLPKVPDAIYSPARGTVSNEAAQLPSSTPRGMFSRTNSNTSFTNPGINGLVKTRSSDDYFVPSHRFGQSPSGGKRERPSISEGDSITVEQLVKLQQAGSKDVQVLLIDVRSRQDFDSGHIMSQATICIDAEVLQRQDISANEILDSMVLAPTREQTIFESRHKFDLIVFYDQDTTKMNWSRGSSASDTALLNLYNALTFFDLDRESEDKEDKTPKLLEGGLEAWINLMGPSSLQTSTTLEGNIPRTQKPMRYRASSILTKNTPKYATKPIQDADEARRWEEVLPAVSADYHRSKDDFLRRFPDISPEKESMISPVLEHPPPSIPLAPSRRPDLRADLSSPLPLPPARPPPTVPRPSFTGLRDSDDQDQHSMAKTTRTGTELVHKRAVGLHNPHNWCYANSSLQALFGSSGFAEELLTGNWQVKYKVPKKGDEKILPPQLLSKIIANLFHWMQNGSFETMQAKTLMDYLYHINSKDLTGRRKREDAIFGGRSQHDAQEFLSFLITELHDETNLLRDKPENVEQPDTAGKTAIQGAVEYWKNHSKCNASLVDKYWRGVEALHYICKDCNHRSINYQVFDLLALPIPASRPSRPSLEQMLDDFTASEHLSDYKCDGCGKANTTFGRRSLARLPELLCVSFRRFSTDQYGHGGAKISYPIAFSVRNFDMSPYFVEGHGRSAVSGDVDAHFQGPFIYDAYAVVVHGGTLTGGHYQAYVQDEGSNDPTLWHHFNDTRVRQLHVGSRPDDPGLQELWASNGSTAYMIFYKRRDTRR